MKILHLGKFYSPIEGGIESINKFIVETFKSTGHQQRVISFNNKATTIEEDVDEVPVIRASSKGIISSQPISLRYFRELRRNIKTFRPDIVHFHYPNPLGALYLILLITAKQKLIVHWHSDVVAQRFLHRLIMPIENLLLKRADVIIATSPNYITSSEILYNYKEKCTVIPCSINEDKFILQDGDLAKIKKLKEKNNGKPIVFFVGRHVEYKGIKYLLEAEKEVTGDCVFIIAGQGPLTDQLKHEFNSSRIKWVGKLSDDEMRIYYHAASIFAFPSITRNEAFGVVLAESMYCGCPAVTFTIPGSGTNWVSINQQTCIEVDNSSISDYARSIDQLLSNDSYRNQLSSESKKRAESLFVKDRVSKLYLSAYKILLANNN